MDWKKQLTATVDAQPVNEGFWNDAKNLVFGKSRGEKEEDIRSNMMKSALGGVHPASPEAPTAPKPDPFKSIKDFQLEGHHTPFVDHVKASIQMARKADAEGHESTVDEYGGGYSGDYRYVGSHDNETLAKSLGASIIAAHTGLPKFDDHDDNFLHSVHLNDEGKLEAHYKSNDRYMRTRHVKVLG